MSRFVVAALLVAGACRGTQAQTVVADAGVQHVRLIPAPVTEMDKLATAVAERSKSSRDLGRTLLVYVGASWCEPCKRFHEAAEKGQLDAELGDLDFLVFDADVDGERLLLAGYESQFVPLLVVPGPDGKASTSRMEGSVKEGAVSDIVPRLKQLLRR